MNVTLAYAQKEAVAKRDITDDIKSGVRAGKLPDYAAKLHVSRTTGVSNLPTLVNNAAAVALPAQHDNNLNISDIRKL